MRQTYGEEFLEIGQYRGGTVRVLGIRSLPALYPRMAINLGWDLRNLPTREGGVHAEGISGYRILRCEGELRTREDVLVGLLWPVERNIDMRSSAYPRESHLTLACDLDMQRLEQIESQRAGKAAQFSVALWVSATQGGEVVDARVSAFEFQIPRDNWIDFLAELKYGEYDVLEFKRPTESLEEFAEVRGQLDVARYRLNRAEYNASVNAARTALERVIVDVKGTASALREVLIARTDKARGDAYTAMITTTKDLCNRAVHKPETSFAYSRAEALFIIRSVESCISLLGDLVSSGAAD